MKIDNNQCNHYFHLVSMILVNILLNCTFIIIPKTYSIKIYTVALWHASEILKTIRNKSFSTGKCGKCEYLETWSGRRGRAYTCNGDYLAEDTICLKGFNGKITSISR